MKIIEKYRQMTVALGILNIIHDRKVRTTSKNDTDTHD